MHVESETKLLAIYTKKKVTLVLMAIAVPEVVEANLKTSKNRPVV